MGSTGNGVLIYLACYFLSQICIVPNIKICCDKHTFYHSSLELLLFAFIIVINFFVI